MSSVINKFLLQALSDFLESCGINDGANAIRKKCLVQVPDIRLASKASILVLINVASQKLEDLNNSHSDHVAVPSLRPAAVAPADSTSSGVVSRPRILGRWRSGSVALDQRPTGTSSSNVNSQASRTSGNNLQSGTEVVTEFSCTLLQLLEAKRITLLKGKGATKDAATRGPLRGLDLSCLDNFNRSSQNNTNHEFFIGRWHVTPTTPLTRSQVAAQLGVMQAFDPGTQTDIYRMEQILSDMRGLLAILVRLDRGKRKSCAIM